MQPQKIKDGMNRDNYADFLKYLLICLVVLGHFINRYQHSTVYGSLYMWIYTFHMPLFVFISGYFSKHYCSIRRKNIDTLLYPFIVFQVLNIIYTAIIPIEPLEDNIFTPYHQNWYLIALFWWRSFIPYSRFFKKWIVLLFAFILCLSVGFFPEWCGFLGLYKTAYFLPFFVLGVYCEDLTVLLSKLMRHKGVWMGVFCISVIVVVALSFDAKVLNIWNYAFKANLGYGGDWHNLLFRVCALVISIVMSLAVLLVTRVLFNRLNSMNLTNGGGTMLAFLGHEFIMIPLISVYGKLGLLGYVLCIVTSFLVTYILTRRRIVEFASPLLDLSILCKRSRLSIYHIYHN